MRLQRSMSFVWILGWVLSCLAHASELKSLYVYSGQPRGGFGDIASNVLMAEQLRKKFPQAKITMVINEEAQDYIQVLLPGYKPDLPTQEIKGLTLQPEGQPLAPADAAFYFSADTHAHVPEDMEAVVSKSLIFQEYGWMKGGWFSPEATQDSPFISGGANGEKAYRFSTGADQSGLYISPQKPARPESREELFRKLSQMFPEAHDLRSPKSSLLALTYTLEPDATDAYIKAISEKAKTLPPDKRIILVVGRDFEQLDNLQVPSNVKVLRMTTSPFALNKSLIANADLPIMITGDVSLTLAVEHEKPFFYEMNPWKEKSIESLKTKMEAAAPELVKKKWAPTVLVPAKGLQDKEALVHTMSDLLFDAEFSSAFPKAFAKLRHKLSLAETIPEYLEVMDLFADRPLSGIAAKKAFRLVHSGTSVSQIFPTLRQDIQSDSAELRRQSLLSLMSTKEAERNPAFLRSLLNDLARVPYIASQDQDHRFTVSALSRKALEDPAFAERLSQINSSTQHDKAQTLVRAVLAEKHMAPLPFPVGQLLPPDFGTRLQLANPAQQRSFLSKYHLSDNQFETPSFHEALKQMMSSHQPELALNASRYVLKHAYKFHDASLEKAAHNSLFGIAADRSLSKGMRDSALLTLLGSTYSPSAAQLDYLTRDLPPDEIKLYDRFALFPELPKKFENSILNHLKAGGKDSTFMRMLGKVKNPGLESQNILFEYLSNHRWGTQEASENIVHALADAHFRRRVFAWALPPSDGKPDIWLLKKLMALPNDAFTKDEWKKIQSAVSPFIQDRRFRMNNRDLLNLMRSKKYLVEASTGKSISLSACLKRVLGTTLTPLK